MVYSLPACLRLAGARMQAMWHQQTAHDAMLCYCIVVHGTRERMLGNAGNHEVHPAPTQLCGGHTKLISLLCLSMCTLVCMALLNVAALSCFEAVGAVSFFPSLCLALAPSPSVLPIKAYICGYTHPSPLSPLGLASPHLQNLYHKGGLAAGVAAWPRHSPCDHGWEL